jgi:hypothetical protein
MSLILSLALMTGVEPLLQRAVGEAVRDELDYGIEATIDQNIEQYMDGVPADYRIVEDDGSITDREALRRNQLRAWSIIIRTNRLTIDMTRFELGCHGACATVWTDQRWDRQMRGRDGVSEHNVVTTQRHEERWELRGSRWVNTNIIELGGTTTVDGRPYS